MQFKSKPISREKINQEIRAYLKIRHDSQSTLNKLPAIEKKYYTSSEIAFVFEKSDLEYLFEKYPHMDCLKAYYGAHVGESEMEDGTPTIILVPCKYESENGQTKVVTLIKSDGDEAIEWPEGVPLADPSKTFENFDIINDDYIFHP